MQPKVDVPNLNGLKIRWRLYSNETEPTSRQRGINVYRQLQEFGIDADAWDGKECADIIVLQYGMRALNEALSTGATVVCDINDQIFAKHHPYYQETMAGFPRVHAVVAGSPRLGEHLRRLHPFVRMIEEGVDKRYFEVPRKEHDGLNAVWCGMHDNIQYFEEIDHVLAELSYSHKFTMHFLCPAYDGQKRPNKDKVAKKQYTAMFHEWTIEAVLEQMALADFAVVPLFQNDWCYCKCANKALSFMAAGLPVVAADVPSYHAVIKQGVNSFLCYHEKDWRDAILMLLTDQKLRGTMGKRARETAQEYSIKKIALQWAELFQEVRPR